jgi:hypothetical protein
LESEAGFATFYLAFGGGRMTINLQKGWLKRPFLYEGGRATPNHLSLFFIIIIIFIILFPLCGIF